MGVLHALLVVLQIVTVLYGPVFLIITIPMYIVFLELRRSDNGKQLK